MGGFKALLGTFPFDEGLLCLKVDGSSLNRWVARRLESSSVKNNGCASFPVNEALEAEAAWF